MAALKPGQLKAGTADAGDDSLATQATPQPGRYEIDTSCSAVTFRTRHLFGLAPVRGTFDRTGFGVTAYRGLAGRHLDMTVEVRCIRK